MLTNAQMMAWKYAQVAFGTMPLEIVEVTWLPYSVKVYENTRSDHLSVFNLLSPYSASKTPRPSDWKRYFHYFVFIPLFLNMNLTDLNNAISNTKFVPNSICRPLMLFLDAIERNIKIVQDVLTECATEMPRLYPCNDSLKTFRADWIVDRYFTRYEALDKPARAVFRALSDYGICE